MKKMKLFPKTFLYTFFMLLFITTSMHLMIYFFYPKVYLSRMQDQLEKKMDTLQQEIKGMLLRRQDRFFLILQNKIMSMLR